MSIAAGSHRSSLTWGDWRLDDLVDAMERARRVLTPSASVFWIGLFPPEDSAGLPTIQVAVPGRDEVELLRDALCEHADTVEFQPDLLDAGFQARTADLHLQVWSTREGFC